MNVQRFSSADLSVALADLSARLGFRAGMVSEDADGRTAAVFGEALSPVEAVRRILRDVRERGDEAVVEYTRKLEGAALTSERLRVSREEMEEAFHRVPASVRDSMAVARDNIRRYQEHIRAHAPLPLHTPEGAVLATQYVPLDRAAVYVPGGKAGYPSTLLMTVVPAQVAGVREIVMVTPCGPDGVVRRETLAAARLLGVKEVYRGAAVALIGAMAYGTKTVRRADKIVGPGNLFVTLAKREVYGEVDLDMLAGPSEILIIADGAADPRFLAADLLSQAEHDPAASVLLTPDEGLANATVAEVERQIGRLSRGEAARRCIEKYGFVGVTRDLDHAVDLANQFAPEHLEVVVADAREIVPRLRNAGAIFVGPWTPEPVGDYVAGPSHVLPTGGTARFFSGLSVNDFLRRCSVMTYTRDALRKAVPDVDRLARAEGLDAHARAATIRFEEERP